MSRVVQWSLTALDDLKEQIAFIAADNPSAARAIAARIGGTALALGERSLGRPGRVTGTYEKRVVDLPYLLAYSITQDGEQETISILRVIHTSRHWPKDRWPR